MNTPGETVDLTVERIVPGGSGLARAGGAVVLLAGGLPGDRLRVRLERDDPRLYRGRILEVLEAGGARRDAGRVCPRALDGSCGGCDWPSAKLDSHEGLKTAIVRDALRRIARLGDGQLPRIGWIGSPRNYRLRNTLHVDTRGRVGFFAPRSNDVSPLETCEIVSKALLERVPAMRAAFAEAASAGELATLEGVEGSPLLGRFRPAAPVSDPARLVRSLLGPFDGIEVVGPDGKTADSVGPSSITVDAGGAVFRVSAGSFFQGNRFLLAPFLDEVRRFLALCGLEPRERAVDLYAGGGFLTRPLLERGLATASVETERSSSLDLASNLAAWAAEGLPRGEAVRARAEAFLARERGPVAAVVLDPPRAGLSREVRRALLRLLPRSILLVSCEPSTLARDIADLKSSYDLREMTLIDLFPGTHHVETLVLLKRE